MTANGPGRVMCSFRRCHAVSKYTVTHTVTRCVTRGKAGVIVITDQCIDRRLLWGGDNARLQRIIHLLNRLSGFISVTCPGSRVPVSSICHVTRVRLMISNVATDGFVLRCAPGLPAARLGCWQSSLIWKLKLLNHINAGLDYNV